MKSKTPCVRAAAARSLALAARVNGSPARQRQKEIIAALQKALEDRALEVVVEAAEALGTLGAPEAGPVLTGLLRHPSEHVRRTAAQALERTADSALLDGLLKGLDDPDVTVRFSLLGAISRAASKDQALGAEQRKRLLERLETILKKDTDQGVRSRAATVLGEVAGPSSLPVLWTQVQAMGEGRVQEKAWDAMVEVISRAVDLALLEKWARTLKEAKQPSRQVQLLARVFARWDQDEKTREQASKALEALIFAQLEQKKWAAAAPLVQNLMARTATSSEAQRERCLKWLVKITEMALREGNHTEALRLAKEARSYLPKDDPLNESFKKLEQQAGRKE